MRPAHDSHQQHRHSPHSGAPQQLVILQLQQAPQHLLSLQLQQVYQLLKIRTPRRGRLRWESSIYHFLIIYSERYFLFHKLEEQTTLKTQDSEISTNQFKYIYVCQF